MEHDPFRNQMAPQFKAHAKHPAVDYLVRLHADIGGRIKVNRQEYERLVADMKAVEAVIRMFDPTYNWCKVSLAGFRGSKTDGRRANGSWYDPTNDGADNPFGRRPHAPAMCCRSAKYAIPHPYDACARQSQD